jgi:hypothetical protein
MKSWVAERNYPAPGAIDDELPVSAIPVASRARCCPAAPVITIIMPPPPGPRAPGGPAAVRPPLPHQPRSPARRGRHRLRRRRHADHAQCRGGPPASPPRQAGTRSLPDKRAPPGSRPQRDIITGLSATVGTMRALPGDGLLVRERQAGEGDREALIIEVWSEHGRPPYVVRWHDGSQNESLPAPADAPIAGGPAAASHFPRRDVCSRGATLRRRGAGRKRAGRGRRARRRRSGQ